jgi:hypothetical protein
MVLSAHPGEGHQGWGMTGWGALRNTEVPGLVSVLGT